MSEFVTVTRRGLGSRGKNSIGGAIFGFLLVALGVVLLFWNEGRAVKRYQDLKEGAGKVVSIDSNSVDSSNEAKLVHLTGETKTNTPVQDPAFGISQVVIKLSREVEMYQWVEKEKTETKKNVGGSETTTKTYSYTREWRNTPVDSSRFKVPEGHANPSEMKYQSTSFLAKSVTLGAFDLPEFLVQKIGGPEPLPIESLESAPEPVKTAAKIQNGGLYFGSDSASPAIGDLRVSFSVIRPGPISVVAQQQGETLVAYQAKTGGTVALLESGILSSDQMFQKAHERNKIMTWAIRAGGFFMLAIGFSMILGPLAVFASILPILGRIVETGTTIIGFLLAAILWTVVVAIAWIFYRPILGIAILAVTVALVVLFFRKLRASRPGEEAGNPPPLETPPPLS